MEITLSPYERVIMHRCILKELNDKKQFLEDIDRLFPDEDNSALINSYKADIARVEELVAKLEIK